jgi:cytochrome c oxidase subunit 3
VYLSRYQQDFIVAGAGLDLVVGAVNTVILLISSFCVAASITAVKRAATRQALVLVGTSVALGGVFLVNKYFEWKHKFHLEIYPGGAGLEQMPPGGKMFYALYYTITGLHGLHVIIGGTALIVAFFLIRRGTIHQHDVVTLDNIGLYWHLVDLVWIFVFPLFYLVV